MRTIEERILNVKGIDYIVREDGKIFSTHNRGRAKYHQEIKQRMNSDGYMCITVGKTGNRTVASVHRLVAKAFIPNPLNLPEVNHKDGHRKDFNFAGTKENNYEDGNLEWVDRKENMLHASRTGLINKDSKKRKISTALNQKKSVEKALRPVALLDDENNILSIFRSIKIAGEITNIPQQNIGEVCRGNRDSAGGFKWEYVDKDLFITVTQEIV